MKSTATRNNTNTFENFMDEIFQMRIQSTKAGFTDKSQLEKDFLPYYERLLNGEKQSVTEYGSGVPILSLYLAHLGKIDKIFAIENDQTVLSELEHIIDCTGMNIEIIKKDITAIEELLDTDIGISVNCLYGYAPTYIQGAMQLPINFLPIIKPEESYNLIKKSKHKKIGIFRAMNKNMTWTEKETTQKHIEELFNTTEKTSYVKDYTSKGYSKISRQTRTMIMTAGIHAITGTDRK